MAQSDNGVMAPRAIFQDVPAPFLSMASFTAALQRGEAPAMRAFYLRLTPLLRDQARRTGVPPDEVDGVVGTVIGDVLLRLVEIDSPPSDLTRYAVSALRNHARNLRRGRLRRIEREQRAQDGSNDGQRIVAECHSEYGLRASRPMPEQEDQPLRRALRKLARYSAQALGPDDAALMIGVSRHLPLRELALQLGISYGNARVRMHRVRARFSKLNRQHLPDLDDDERREMDRFLRRAGVILHDDAGAPSSPRPRREPMPAREDLENDA